MESSSAGWGESDDWGGTAGGPLCRDDEVEVGVRGWLSGPLWLDEKDVRCSAGMCQDTDGLDGRQYSGGPSGGSG